jgi:hypothetical protein
MYSASVQNVSGYCFALPTLRAAISLLIVLASLLGCDSSSGVNQGSSVPAGHGHHKSSEQELVRIAKDYLQQHRPEWVNVDHLQPMIIEHPDYWEVTWALPPGIIGGAPVLHLDKDTREVIEIHHTQ